ncbi:MAG: PorT family protein [Bacteroidales bacterium]|nr:PorT family protein [Bacteroidales bacterium]
MKTKLLTLSAVFIFAAFTLQAQIGFGILGGINLQNINGKDGSGEKLTNALITGFHAGVNVNIPVAPDFYFQPGLLFSVKGAKNEFFSPPTKASADYSTTTKLSYMELPLNLLYRPLLGKGHILLGFGPYIAFGIGGKENSDFGSLGSYERKVKFKTSVSDLIDLIENAYYRPFDAGANIFFGYELANGIFCQMDAQLGMLKINPEYSWISDDKRSYKNTGFGFSIGYRF